MKVAYLTHFYPPSSCGGAGKYASMLVDGMARKGIDCAVLCALSFDEGDKNYNGYVEDKYHEVPVRRLRINWSKALRPFDYTYDNPTLSQPIKEYLDVVKPDLVHIISCYTLSGQAIEVSKACGIPVVLHLVDMWFICPKLSLIRGDGSICFGSTSAWECQRCLLLPTDIYRISSTILDDEQQCKFFTILSKCNGLTRMRGLRGMLGDLARRRAFTISLLEMADVVIAPSQTLLGLYRNNGMVSKNVISMPYGHDLSWANQVRRTKSDVIRIGYLGNIIPIKGVHVLVDAFKELGSQGIELHIYGDEQLEPSYAKNLKDRKIPGISWHGRYQPSELAEIFSNLDLIVFPSLWHENNPLVIQEAFAGGCPVVSSDMGGAAEFVDDQVNGMLFKSGDAMDLYSVLKVIVESPDRIETMRGNIQPVRAITEDISMLSHIYHQLLA